MDGMDQAAASYRAGLIEAIILLLLLILAFGTVTLMARDRWLALGATESLLARLAAAILLASVAVGGWCGVILNVLQAPAFRASSLAPVSSRNEAGLLL